MFHFGFAKMFSAAIFENYLYHKYIYLLLAAAADYDATLTKLYSPLTFILQ